MSRLPVIVGFGGINAAGRSSGHHGYRRLVIDALGADAAAATRASLAALTNRLSRQNGQWLDAEARPVRLDEYLATIAGELNQATLIRKLENNLFDPEHIHFTRRARLNAGNGAAPQFEMRRKQLPSPLPQGWTLSDHPADPAHKVMVSVRDDMDVLLDCSRRAPVNSAGQLPGGFDPARLYQSRNHPRALQLTVYAASDAINSLGLEWDRVKQAVAPDQISVYAGSAMGQLDYNGFGGLLQAAILGRKVTSKHMPLGYAEMPADFINAYLLGNLGTTGTNVAACATFLYNLKQGMRDIQSGSHRVAIIGTSEAPLFPESFDGFTIMGALADDKSLRKLDKLDADQHPDFSRACRPFGENAGFTVAESAQYVVLFDDELALELGANILGGVNEVFVNADGHKKSITSPGLGNYITMAKAAAATRNIIGDQGLKQRSYVQAHGTGTPQNRRTESHILSRVATTWGIDAWPVTAVKAYVGHSIASSAGDQLAAGLGVWAEGIIPGILTIDGIADDVSSDGLDFLTRHREVGRTALDAVLINSKGFGGNNATASILAPHIVERMLHKRHGNAALSAYRRRNQAVREQAAAYDQSAVEGVNSTIYKFDHHVLGSESIRMNRDAISVAEIVPKISLKIANKYSDMCDES